MEHQKKLKLKKIHGVDTMLIFYTFILSVAGIVLAFSASYYYSISKTGNPYSFLLNNIVYAGLGWAALIFFSHFDYHLLRNFAKPAIVIGVILLLMLIVFRGTGLTKTINNATRWLNFGVSVMPGELIKPALILFLSAFLSAKPNAIHNIKYILGLVVLILGIGALIMKQPNLSTAVIVMGIGFVILFASGLSYVFVLIVLALAGAAGFYLIFINTGYWHTRIATAFDPWSDALGDGYQVVQSLLALGSGGVFGKGLGKSIQKTLYLPEPQSDFILPIIGEECGFLGILIIFVLYILLVQRLISTALRSRDRFGCYLATGTAALIIIHVILNVAVITASFPPTGVFLPFMSQGGNASVVILVLIGICLNVSRQADEVPEEDDLE